MWSDKFNEYLHKDIEYKRGSSFDECDKSLQSLFKNIILGIIPVEKSGYIFNKVKNTALIEIVKINKSEIDSILDFAYNLGVKKNVDYGSDNILKYGIVGLIVRIGDKISRIQNLTKNNKTPETKDEKVYDTLVDILNYATYGEMLADGIWG